MKKQLQFQINNDKKIVVDLKINESISFVLNSVPPNVKDKELEDNLFYKIDGLRWRNDEYFHLEWEHREFKINDAIKIEFIESDLNASKLSKEELFIQPEEECSFCSKKLSEVEVLVEGSVYTFICNECINCCQELLSSDVKNKVPIKYAFPRRA